jgi:hypothetical protein
MENADSSLHLCKVYEQFLRTGLDYWMDGAAFPHRTPLVPRHLSLVRASRRCCPGRISLHKKSAGCCQEAKLSQSPVLPWAQRAYETCLSAGSTAKTVTESAKSESVRFALLVLHEFRGPERARLRCHPETFPPSNRQDCRAVAVTVSFACQTSAPLSSYVPENGLSEAGGFLLQATATHPASH